MEESSSGNEKNKFYNYIPFPKSISPNRNTITSKKTSDNNLEDDDKIFEEKVINIKLKKNKKLNVNNIEYKTISFTNENNTKFEFKLFKDSDLKLEQFIKKEIKKKKRF